MRDPDDTLPRALLEVVLMAAFYWAIGFVVWQGVTAWVGVVVWLRTGEIVLPPL